MAINFRIASNYNQEQFDLIKNFESFKDHVYDLGEGVPTLGYGYALIVKDGNSWEIKNTLDEDLAR